MNDSDKNLLKLIAASIATGAGGHALFRSILAPKKVFNEKKDLYTPSGSPVYVDMSPEEASRFEELTGMKSANVKLAELNKAAEDDYSWLTKALAAGGGAYAGWSILDKVLDTIRKRKLDGELAQAQNDLGALYATKPIKGVKDLPANKKIGALQEFMDGSYEFWKAAHYAPNFELALKEAGLAPAISASKMEIGDKEEVSEEDFNKAGVKDPNLKALITKAHRIRKGKKDKKDTKSDKTAGIIDSIGSVAATPVTAPIKSMAGYGLKSIAPVLAAIALISAYGAYQNHKGVAGDRRDLKAVRNEARQAEDRPYIELKPRVVSPE
jgi:hypothetical protein